MIGFSVKDFAGIRFAAHRLPFGSVGRFSANSPLRVPSIGSPPLGSIRPGLLLAALIGWVCLTGLVVLSPCSLGAATIILDPGHGGGDGGASGGGTFSEKQFTLALAQKMAGLLAGPHRVELTRSADFAMNPVDRAAVANQLRADLMISLHAGVAPYCSAGAVAIYYHNDERLSFPYDMVHSDPLIASNGAPPLWSRLQARHRHRSEQAAVSMKRVLENHQTVDNVTVSGVPLVALMGADLPALLIEIGCLHPAEAPPAATLETQLNAYAEALAEAVESAIEGLGP